jgi:hypothetical protein
MSIRNLLRGRGDKERPALKAYDLTAICKSDSLEMVEPLRVTTVWVSTVCYGDGFTGELLS